MLLIMRKLFPILLLSFCIPATAGIYKWVDENKNVHYSDKKPAGAKEIKLPKAVTYTPKKVSSTGTQGGTKGKEKGPAEITITTPAMNQTIRSHEGIVPVGIALNPAMDTGDSITLYLDGKVVLKDAIETSITLANIDRGSHTLRAMLKSAGGTTKAASKSIVFHLQRTSIAAPNNRPEDNSDSFTPNYGQEVPGNENTPDDGNVDVNENFGSQGSYQEGARDFNRGIPSNSGSFAPGNSFTPNFNQNR